MRVTKIRVFLTDDHPLLLEGVSTLIRAEADMELVGTAQNGLDAVARVPKLKPDVVIMDIQMPGMNGVEATRRIKELCPRTKVVMLTTYSGDACIRESIDAGSSAYITKGSVAEELIRTVREVYAGEHIMIAVPGRKPHMFTKSQVSIVEMLAQGNSMREIAFLRNVPLNSIQEHVSVLYDQVGVDSVLEIVQYAIETKQVQKPSLALAGTANSRGDDTRTAIDEDTLTAIEIRVLQLAAEGASNAEIADQLAIAEGAVKASISRVKQKIGAADRVVAVLEGLRRGIISS